MISRVAAVFALLVVAVPLFAASPVLEPGPLVCRDGCGAWAVADLNGDGLDDILGFGRTYINTGGRFDVSFANGLHDSDSVSAVADFNEDDIADVLIASGSTGFAQIYLNDGHGALIRGPRLTHGGHPYDFDGDGRMDLITIRDGGIHLMRGNGDATFTPHQVLPTTEHSGGARFFETFAVGDLNRDGRRDLIFSAREYFEFYFGREDGTFAPAVRRFVGRNARFLSIQIADVDRDRNDDLIFLGAELMVLFGDGRGRFPRVATAALGGNLSATHVIAAPLFSSVPQIVVATQQGVIVTYSAATGTLQEVARTSTGLKNAYVMAGRLVAGNQIDLIALGLATPLAGTGAVALVTAEGALPVLLSETNRGSRRRAAAPARGEETLPIERYSVEWSGACPPPVHELIVEHEGIFMNVKNTTMVEMSRIGDFSVALNYEGRRYTGTVVEIEEGRYVGPLGDVNPRGKLCDGSVGLHRMTLVRQ